MKKIRTILIICMGNTARSPVAEYLAKYYSHINNITLEIESAGFINAFNYIQPQSKAYLDLKGIKYSDFKPQLINHNLLKKFELIITMERSHKDKILNNYKSIDNLKNKVYTLKEFNYENENLDIIDPYYGSSKEYYKILEIIEIYIEKMIKRIIKINESK